MSDPATYQEYLELTHKNTIISGFGIGNVFTEYPCPACAAPHWKKCELMETEKVLRQPATCSACGRTFKALIETSNEGASTRLEMVQTGGPDMADYFDVKMRRVDS